MPPAARRQRAGEQFSPFPASGLTKSPHIQSSTPQCPRLFQQVGQRPAAIPCSVGLTPRPLFPIALFAVTASVGRAKSPGTGSTVTFNFDSDKPGEPPAGFEFARTGNGAEGNWVVRQLRDSPGKHVLVQESADQTDYRFPLAVVSNGTYNGAAPYVVERLGEIAAQNLQRMGEKDSLKISHFADLQEN